MSKEAAITLREIEIQRDQRVVLSDFSATFQYGTITAIIGPNGSGKSSLVEAMSGNLPLSHGDIFYGMNNLAGISPQEQSRFRSVVLQNQRYSLGFRVREIVCLGSKKKSPDWFENALRSAGALNLAERNILDLSGGETQRVAIAHALAQDTDVLILDEPLSAQDGTNKDHLMSLFKSLREKGKTVIFVAHMGEEDLAWCDQIIQTNP
jgi:ABC-type cobalamin/Fe3+-siderophores transport system ATPase subunit